MKRLVTFILSLAALAFGAGLFILLLNLYDPLLKPEVRQVLDSKPQASEEQIRAYHHLVGLHMGELSRPEERGRELLESSQVPGNLELRIAPFPCARPSFCTSEDLSDPGVRERLKADRPLLEAYVKLLERGTVTLLQEDLADRVRLVPLTLDRGTRALYADWLKKGGRERVLNALEMSNRYYASVMRTGTLVDRIMATIAMKENADFLLHESNRDPSLKANLTPQLIESFTPPDPEDIFAGALDVELRYVHRKVKDISQNGEFEQLSPPVLRSVAHLLLRPNETLNRYHEIQSQIMASDCPEIGPENIEKCIPGFAYVVQKSFWSYIENPMGRFTLKLTAGLVAPQRLRIKQRVAEIFERRSALTL